MNVSQQWRDTYVLLQDFIEELRNNSYNRMETSFRFRDKFLEMQDTYNNTIDAELVQVFDFLRFNLTCCENIHMAVAILCEAKLLAELKGLT